MNNNVANRVAIERFVIVFENQNEFDELVSIEILPLPERGVIVTSQEEIDALLAGVDDAE